MGSLFTLQNDTLARLSVFVLGALPQIIKLYAMRSVPWTTVWVSMLFSSFLALEVLVLILGRSWRELSANVHQGTPQDVRQSALQGNDTPASHLETTLGLEVAMASVGWCSYFLAVAAHAALLRDSVVSVLIMMYYSILAAWVSQLGELALAETVLRISVPFCVAVIAYIYGRALLWHTHHLTGSDVCFVLSFCIVGPIWPLKTAAKLLRLGDTILVNREVVYFLLQAHFLLLQFRAAWFYYSFKYDAQGTLKPSWTEILG